MSIPKVKECDGKITEDQIKTSWQSNGPEDWYDVKIIDKTKTRTQKQAKQLGQQILENQTIVNILIKKYDELIILDEKIGLLEFKQQLALLRSILITYHSKSKGENHD